MRKTPQRLKTRGLLLFLVLLIPLPCFGQPSVNSGDLLSSADEILEIVSELRELEIKRPVEKGIKSRSEIETFLMERINKEYPIPPDLDLYAFMLELLTEQLAGYYDPYSETFYIADWIPLALQEPVMAHELTHALQDQHFNLEQYLKPTDGNDDTTLARSALIEGEGLLIMLDYSLRPMGRTSLDIPDIIEANRAQTAMIDAQFPVFANAPNYLRETLLFPYTYGASFLQKIVRRSSWSQVNEIYADLPTSTEQILHPSRYFEERDEPTRLNSSKLPPPLSGTWETVFENVLGEFTLYLLLQEGVDEGIALTASNGWDGDSIRLLENSEGKEAVILQTIWDSKADADQFQTAYLSAVKKRFPDLQPVASAVHAPESKPANLSSWEDRQRSVFFTWEDNRVDILELEK